MYLITGSMGWNCSLILSQRGKRAVAYKLPISAIAEILYCPRNFYYRVVEQAQDYNEHTLEGKYQEKHREERPTQWRTDRKQYRKIYLDSEFYKIAGILDVVEEKEDLIYPVEFKKGYLRNNLNDDVQVCCQALLLEEYLKREIDKGYIYYVESASRRVVTLSQELRELTIHTIEQGRYIVEEQLLPEPVNDQRCNGCSLIERCLPQEMSFIKTGNTKPRRPVPTANLGRVLYVDTPGVYLRKKDGRILLTKDKEVVKDIPINAVDQIILIGPVNISSQLIQEFLKRSIPVHFGTTYGNHLGWLNPTLSKNSLLRLAQARTVDNSFKSLEIAKAFIKGKLANMRTLLMRYNRSLQKEEISAVVEQLSKINRKVATAKSKDELLGYEGNGSREYFKVFDLLVKNNNDFYFSGRNRRPPRDPINTMLSYGYTLLNKEVVNELVRVGLDPYLGFFHSNIYGRPALGLDLMEEFRAIIVDSAVLTAINTSMVNEDDFEFTFERCQMTEKGRKALFQAYRNRINEEITHPIFDYKLSYRRIIELQARFLAKVLTNELEEYQSFLVR
ncbi:MAG: CRISPR-associated endonuclease Cas4g/Cas1g [Peptococcales bacterium]|jgi:CRISPR-associated protein Cas1